MCGGRAERGVAMTQKQWTGRIIKQGQAQGEVLYSAEPLSFFGGVDVDTGIVSEKNHPLFGQCIAHKVLIFPQGKGSTVGSYALLRLAKNGLAPAAIINRECETVVAVGCIIAGIPCVDKLPIEDLAERVNLQVDAAVVSVQMG